MAVVLAASQADEAPRVVASRLMTAAGLTTLRKVAREALLAPSPLQRYRAGTARSARHGDVALVALGPPGIGFNFVVVLAPARARQVLDLAASFFGAPDGFAVVLELSSTGNLGEELVAQGWRLDEEEAALVLPSLPVVAPPTPPGLSIRRVDSDATLADFDAVRGGPSGFPLSLAAAHDPAVGLFVGYFEGVPAATSRVVRLGRIAEISTVVTVPSQRRRGFGTALTWAAVVAGRSLGCDVAMLTATSLGYPVYTRMGFVPVDIYRTYVPRERIEH